MMCRLTLSAPQLKSSSQRPQSQSHKVWPVTITCLTCKEVLCDQILGTSICRDLLGKAISRKIGPNPNSERTEETHRARDRNYTSFRAFREATTNSSEKEAATTTMTVYAYLNCFYLIQAIHTFYLVGKSIYSAWFKFQASGCMSIWISQKRQKYAAWWGKERICGCFHACLISLLLYGSIGIAMAFEKHPFVSRSRS